jgi:integrase
LRKINRTGARALEFLILTTARTAEVAHATWGEMDLDKRLWVIPAERMKAGQAHTVPLSDSAMALLQSLPRTGAYVFPNKSGGPLDDKSMDAVLKKLDGDSTVHGLRSTFSDWANDSGHFDAETNEHSLAHKVGDKVAQAYRRGTGLEKRKVLMQSWANYCEGTAEADNVVKLHG